MIGLLLAAVLLLSLFLIRQVQVTRKLRRQLLEAQTTTKQPAKTAWVVTYQDGKAQRRYTAEADTESKALAEFIQQRKSYSMIVSVMKG